MSQINHTFKKISEDSVQRSKDSHNNYVEEWTSDEISILTSALQKKTSELDWKEIKKDLPDKPLSEIQTYASRISKQRELKIVRETEQADREINSKKQKDEFPTSTHSSVDCSSKIVNDKSCPPTMGSPKASLLPDESQLDSIISPMDAKLAERSSAISNNSNSKINQVSKSQAPRSDPFPASEAQGTVLNPDTVTSEEKEANREFFASKSRTKTPQRYMELRNQIINEWNKIKPNYLSKAAIRKVIQNPGCLTTLGKLHQFLEDIGAINLNSLQFAEASTLNDSESKTRCAEEKNLIYPKAKNTSNKSNETQSSCSSKRLRDVPSSAPKSKARKVAIDEDEKISRNAKQSAKKSTNSELIDTSFEQYELMDYTAENPAPLNVKIHKSAMVIMEVHAHLCNYEVVGLMGGKYDPKEKSIEIKDVYPAKNISSEMECEMDITSQFDAQTYFEKQEMQVLGWYHSHPTFSPNPSEVDIDTQANFQLMSRDNDNGVDPYIGVIINPYSFKSNLDSHIECILIEQNDKGELILPYRILFEYVPFAVKAQDHYNKVEEKIYNRVQSMVKEYQEHEQGVILTEEYITKKSIVFYTDKIKHVIENHLKPAEQTPTEEYIDNQEVIDTLHQYVDRWETL